MKALRLFGSALLAMLLSVSLISCGGGGSDDNSGGGTSGGGGSDGNFGTVESKTVSANASGSNITINCRVIDKTIPQAQSVGAIAGEKPNPTFQDATFNGKPTTITSQGTYSITFTGLRPNTKYYVRSYYYTGTKFYYGEPTIVTTGAANITFVDLGLPSTTIWAECNLGAEKPQDVGSYFVWGEVHPVNNARSKSFQANLLDVDDSKDPIGDLTENLRKLDPAYVYWGDDWCTPSEAQLKELRNECNWTWQESYKGTGVKGYLVTSKSNSKSIFLPVTGYYNNTTLNAKDKGYYRSRLTSQNVPSTTKLLYFSIEGQNETARSSTEACVVRPVKVRK